MPDLQTPNTSTIPAVDSTQTTPQQISSDQAADTTAAVQPITPTAQPVQSAVAQPPKDAATAQRHGMLGEIFETLAGGKRKVWTPDPKTGVPVATYEDLSGHDIARGILAAAITGLAAGYDPKNRGKGPAMSSAFSAGFKGEEQAREKTADQAQEQAQEQFKNKNISDEMILRKQKAATEQQEAISRMSKDAAEIQQIQQRAAEGKILFDEGQKDRIINQQGAFDAKKTAGWTEIPHPVTPGESFGFADMKEAQEFANKYGAHLVNPGEFNTAPVYNPATGLWVPMMQPKGYDELKQVRFAKLDKDGKPMKDPKNPGKWVPDGSKDASGRTMTPTEMTNKDYEAWMTNDTKMRMDRATAAEKYAMANELAEKQKKDKMLAQADSRYADSGGDPFAVNIKDGMWTMTDGDRSRLRNAAVSNLAGMEKAREAAQKELENASSDAERAAVRATFAQADQGWQYYNTQLASLNGRVSKAGSLANAYVKEYSDENGFDGKKALDKFDEAVKRGDYKTSGMSDEELARTKANILSAQSKAEAAKKSGPTGTSVGTDVINKATQVAMAQLQKGQDPDQIIQQLVAAAGDKVKFSDEDLNKIRSSMVAAPAGKVRMRGPDNDIKDVDQKDVAAVKAGGYKILDEKAQSATQAVGEFQK